MTDTLSLLDEARNAFEDFKKEFNKKCPEWTAW